MPTNATIQTIDSTTNSSQPPNVKILWMYWEQGLEHLKSLAEDPESKYTADYNCVQAWLKLNPNWDIRVLDKAEAMKLAPKYAILANDTTGRISRVTASDVLRLELLTLYGGVWSDTSNCPFRPLDNFVPSMLQATKFFAPYLDSAGGLSGDDLEQFHDCHTWKSAAEARSSGTWFLAASQPHHVIMEKWLNALYERMVEKMTAPTKVHFPYFVAHCTFTQTRLIDPEVETAWKEFQKSPHFWEGEGGHVCFADKKCGTARCSAISSMVDGYPQKCFFVKKQGGELLKYVQSPAYLEYVDTISPQEIPSPITKSSRA